MTLAAVFESLPSTARRHESTFPAARAGEPAFAPYSSATALLEAVSEQSPLTLPERQEVVRALIDQYRAAPHLLWQALLLGAFEPLLLALRARVHGPKDDRDAPVLLAFLQAIGTRRVAHLPAFLVVRQETARLLFRALRAERGEGGTLPFDELSAECAPSPHANPGPFVACLASEIAEQIARQKGGEDVVRVLAGLETAAEQVARLSVAGPSGVARKRADSERLRKRRQRALAQVRTKVMEGGQGGRS